MKGSQKAASDSSMSGRSSVQLGLDRTMIARNVTVAGRRTSLRLEPEMWDALVEIGARESLSLHQLCTEVNRRRQQAAAR